MPEPTAYTVFDPPADYTAQEAIAALPRMLLGDDVRDATQRLRDECTKWLPPYEAEEKLPGADGSPSDYDTRVARAIVEPYYERAILRDVASVLGKPVVLKQDVPLEIRGTDERGKDGWWENIDLRGNDGNLFLKEVVKDAAGDRGFSVVLVDHPQVGGDAKLSDLQAAGLRPFWRHYKARDVIEAVPEYINGRERARSIRLREEAPEGYERVRRLFGAPWNEAASEYTGFVTFELWERKKSGTTDAEKAGSIIERGDMRPHREISAACLYYQRTGFFRGRNAYMGLARMNLLHTAEACDNRDDLWLHGGTQLVLKGGSDADRQQRVIGRRRVISSAAPDFSAERMTRPDPSGGGYIEELQSLEAKMERLANEPHVRRSGNETATGRAIDTAEAKTEIQARCIAVRDFVESLLMFTAAYAGHKSGGSVDVTSPQARMDRDLDGIDQAKDCAVKGWVRPVKVLELMQKQGIWPDDFDAEVEFAEAQAEGERTPPADLRPTSAPGDRLAKMRAAMAAAEGGNGGAVPPGGPAVQ